jgi:tetratricopeptide (TPR) repeat protein
MDEAPEPAMKRIVDAGGARPRLGLLGAAALVVITLLAYGPAFDAGFVFDDSLYVTEDGRMGSAEGLRQIWAQIGGPEYRHQYYPLTSTVFWLQHGLWGDRPFGYHLVNVLLHAVNAVLVWRVLTRLGVPGAWLAGAIFAVHPVHVPSVAWVAELKNVLSGAFFLTSMLVYVRAFGLDDRSRAAPLRFDGTYALGLALFVCALLSKTASCVLPVALLLAIWWKRGAVQRRHLAALAPLIAVGLSFALLTAHLEAHQGGAAGEPFALPWLDRLLIAGRAVCFYADKLVRPVGLVFIYPRWAIDTGAWTQYLYPLAVVGGVAGLWLARHRIGRAPVAAAAFFIAAVAPISLVNVAFARFSFVADHWQYWASLGPIALAVGAAATLARRHLADPWTRRATVAVAVVAVAGFGGLTRQRATVFESRETLWRDTIARNPGAWVAHHNLGAALGARGRVDEAIAQYRRALDLHPDYADAHNSLAVALRGQGHRQAAIEHYRAALRVEPGFAEAHYNLANALHAQGDACAAIRHYREAIRLGPDRAMIHNNLGVALFSEGRAAEAVECFGRALEIDPTDAGARRNLELALAAR